MDLNYTAYQQNRQQHPPPSRFGNGAPNSSGGTPLGVVPNRLGLQAAMHEGQFGGFTSPGTPSSSNAIRASAPTTITPPSGGRNFSPYGNPSNNASTPQASRSPPASQSINRQFQQQTMAAPLISNPTQPGAMQSPIKTSIPPLPTAETAKIDQERVTLLLEINQLLLQEIVTLQEAGKGGDVQSPAKEKAGGEEGKPLASPEYVECMRRMQSNLAYLANVAERSSRPNQPIMPYPPLMGVPTLGPSQLPAMYTRLQNMFPQWKLQQQNKASGNLSPGPGSVSAGGTPGGGP